MGRAYLAKEKYKEKAEVLFRLLKDGLMRNQLTMWLTRSLEKEQHVRAWSLLQTFILSVKSKNPNFTSWEVLYSILFCIWLNMIGTYPVLNHFCFIKVKNEWQESQELLKRFNLQFISKRRGRPNAVTTVAPTGKAAYLVSSETLHSLFKFNSTNFKSSMVSEENKGKRKELFLLLYDEVWMAGKHELANGFHMLKRF